MDDMPVAFAQSHRIWLNTAHQGPLPVRAGEAVQQALEWKLRPHHLQGGEMFASVPERLRTALAQLLGADSDDVILANSASYGLHLLANGLPFEAGDDVLVAGNDFPSDVLPWLGLRDRGVGVQLVEPEDEVLTVDEVRRHLTRRTRVVCLTWVHSFSGHVIDLDAIGQLCRDSGTLFVVNAAQGLGSLPLDFQARPVDALVSVGFKWLCGPYGTGLACMRGEVRERLAHLKRYWLHSLTADDLAAEALDLEAVEPPARGRLDVFGTANFLNFLPFAVAVELLLEVGMPAVARHDAGLVARLLDDLDRDRYRVVSTQDGQQRSTIVMLEPAAEAAADIVSRLASAGIDVAERRSRIRLSPHLHNSPDDIHAVLDVL